VQLKYTPSDRLQKRLVDLLAEAPTPRSVNGSETLCLGTNIGAVRQQNEDRALIVAASYSDAPERNFVLGVVSDGIGGLPRGDEASTLAVSEFCSRVIRQSKLLPEVRLKLAAEMANEAVFSLLNGKGGATLSAAMIVRGKFFGVNVGDSRIYGISADKQAAQLTQDDTLASYLGRREGKGSSINEKGLVQFIGMGDGVEPHIIVIPDKNLASILITSDGVHDAPSDAITQIAHASLSNLDLVRRLLSLSGILGGRDNATALVMPTNFNLENTSQHGVTITCISSFDALEIWIPSAENALVEGDNVLQKHENKRLRSGKLISKDGRT
jgi:serine/threonine protein phosphatase PrpC